MYENRFVAVSLSESAGRDANVLNPGRGEGPPRIGFVGLWHGTHHPDAWSGVQTQLMEQLDAMDLFGGYLDASPPWPAPLRAMRKALRRIGHDGPLRYWGIVPQALLGGANLIRRATQSDRCDAWIVPAMGYGTPVRGRVASLCEIAPAQIEAIDLTVVQSMWPGISRRHLRTFGRQQLRLHRSANVCCVATRWAGRSLASDHGIDPGKVHVVGYGANMRMSPPADRDWSTPRYLFIGLGWSRKNGDRVVGAFTRLRQRYPDATLDIVGDHPRLDAPGVRSHGRVHFSDREGRALLESLYREATCFVLPSVHESFGIVYVEAAGAGLPSIGTTVGGTEDSVGDGGVLVDPLDEGAVYAAMLRLADPGEARRLGAIAQRRSALFTWDKVAQRIVRALDLPGVDNSKLAAPL